MIVVVDYGRGNLFSLGQALHRLGAEAMVSGTPAAIARAPAIILPGVGAFADAMAALNAAGLVRPLKEAAARGVPMLGICLGLQLFMEESEEFGRHEGLGLIPGAVKRMPEPDAGDPGAVRIPNVGWRRLTVERDDPLLSDAPDGAMYYFVHSYGAFPRDPSDVVASLTVNGARVAAIARRHGVVGCQFHPEKSGPAGLALLKGFIDDLAHPAARTKVAHANA